MPLVEPFVATLYRDHHTWLHRLLQRRLPCAETAADLVQDVFVRLLGRPALPAMDEPRAYLARIANGLAIDHRRRQAVERAWLETLAALPEAQAPSAEDSVLIIDALARVDALLDGLKPRVREVFLLSRLEGLSHPAIARQLQVSLSTVEKDMALALRHCYRVMLG
ncbi:RNA polymerase subunit sigma [Alkalilimnicola ehrlichii]|uniref:RNA polymerase subunit sigma n=1 Tax=Alkalilimnicola ehrlichii TaxID=351052 RepID=A0A3E0WNQ2_9GAMM|nr:sigma-70 family RNA polymerase sigma factor [Alkalilimnicola ehrlichii]RFA27817.1 RNA polymerase subunit sigma [Alkalilimnicola ehrlichii]RFA33606.1 RNA polymerase subunit sigma [Alkalilimnicola ehrlichii]